MVQHCDECLAYFGPDELERDYRQEWRSNHFLICHECLEGLPEDQAKAMESGFQYYLAETRYLRQKPLERREVPNTLKRLNR